MITAMKLMIPFTPHIAFECLEKLNCKDPDNWPKLKNISNEKIKFAVQVNGKTRDIISVHKKLTKEQIDKIINDNSKAKRFLENKNVMKTIFVQDKIINYIIKNEN